MMYVDLMDKFYKGEDLAYRMKGIHARTGQLNENWRDNGWVDAVKILIADPMMLDLTYKSDVRVLEALNKLGVAGERKYVLVHDSELNSPQTRSTYEGILNQPENDMLDLLVEEAPKKMAHENMLVVVDEMRNIGLQKTYPVVDTVHYFKGLGMDFRNMSVLTREWSNLLRYIERSEPVLIHWSEGDPDDGHDMERIRVEGKTMMKELACLLQKTGTVFMTENQRGVLGPIDWDRELDTQKRNGAFYQEVKLIKENEFVE